MTAIERVMLRLWLSTMSPPLLRYILNDFCQLETRANDTKLSLINGILACDELIPDMWFAVNLSVKNYRREV